MILISYDPRKLVVKVNELEVLSAKIIQQIKTKHGVPEDWFERFANSKVSFKNLVGKYLEEAKEYINATKLFDELTIACQIAIENEQKIYIDAQKLLNLKRWKDEWGKQDESS